MAVKMSSKVSVIMPVYNAEKHLAASIRSVLTQSHKNLELVIVNDGSTDGSEDVVRTFMNRDDRIKYIVQKHQGVSAARNRGIKAAEGQWIAYLDSDDIAMTDRLERCLNFTYRIGEKCMVYGGWFRFNVERNKFRILDYAKGYLDSFDIFLLQNKNQFICSTVMHHKDCIVKAGFFDENLQCEEDWDMWLRISDDHPVYQLDEVLVFRRVGTHGDYFRKGMSDKVVEECRRYVTEKRIKKLLGIYSTNTDSETAKKIFFATLDIKDDKLRRAVLERLESWRIFGTVAGLVKTAPKQAFELLEKYKDDKLIAHIIREKIFDFSFSMTDVTNEEFSYIKGVLESLITSE